MHNQPPPKPLYVPFFVFRRIREYCSKIRGLRCAVTNSQCDLVRGFEQFRLRRANWVEGLTPP